MTLYSDIILRCVVVITQMLICLVDRIVLNVSLYDSVRYFISRCFLFLLSLLFSQDVTAK